MVEFIALGVEERGGQDTVNGSSDNHKQITKGLYLFEHSGKNIDGCIPAEEIGKNTNIFTKSSPDLVELLRSDGSSISTPRVVKNVGNMLYLISRGHVTQLSYNASVSFPFSMNKFSLLNFITGIGDDLKKKIDDKDNLVGFIDTVYHNTVYLSLFLSNTLREENSFQEISQGVPLGLVLRHTVGTDKAEVVLPNYNPTGEVFVQRNTLKMVSKKNLLSFTLDGLVQTPDILNSEVAEANILDVSSVDGYTLFSTNKEGYVLKIVCNSHSTIYDSKKLENYSSLSDSSRMYLPSPATSVLIYKDSTGISNPRYYALFGLERGKIRVYEINKESNSLDFKKTIPFISVENNDVARERYILNLKQVSGHVCFTMGNLFMKIPFSKLLDFDGQKRIVRNQEKGSPNDYLTSFKECYGVDTLFHVPHRITSYDFWSVK